MGFIELWGSWIWIAGIAFGLMVTIIAIVYMLSEFLMNDRMKSWAKMELAEVFYSAILLAMLVSSVPVANSVMQVADSVAQASLGVSNTGIAGAAIPGGASSMTMAWIPTTDYDPFKTTKSYQQLDICGPAIAQDDKSVYHGIESCHMRLGIWFMRELFDESKTYGFDIYMSYIFTSMAAEFTINIEFIFEKAGFFTFTPWRGFYTMGNKIKEMGFDFSTKNMLLTKFQEVFLRFIAIALFPAFAIIGVVLRTFSFTRKLGGLLLAIALGLYFVMPAFYAFGALVMLDLKNNKAIQDAWFASPANPANSDNNPASDPHDFPDVPIANTMYITGDLTMVGGTGSVSIADAKKYLEKYEGMNPTDYYKAIESGSDKDGAGTKPSFDLTSKNYDSASPADKDAAMATANKAAQSWFGTVSNFSAYDKFMNRVWVANGPIDGQARLTFWSVFFGLMGLLATIATIRSLAVTFGGDIEIAGLTRLI